MKRQSVLLVLVTMGALSLALVGCSAQPTTDGVMIMGLAPGDLLGEVVRLFHWLVGIPEVKFIGGHVLLNVLVAVAAAIAAGEFKLHRLAEFLWRKLTPYVLVYAAARLFGEATGLAAVAPSVFALIEAALLSDLVENLERLGLRLPEPVSRLISKG